MTPSTSAGESRSTRPRLTPRSICYGCIYRGYASKFRAALNSQNYGVDGLEKQQRELRDRIPPIHDAVRNKLKAHIRTLEFRYKVKPDDKMKAEIERLKLTLEGIPEQWGFFPW